MTTYSVIEALCENRGIAITALEKELGFGRGSIGKLKNGGSMTFKRLQMVANYFGVSVDTFTSQVDEEEIRLDVAEEIQKLINYLTDDKSSYCYGEVMSEEGKLALLNSLKQDKEFLTALTNKENK